MKTALLGFPLSGKKTLFTLLTGRPIPLNRKPGESIEGVAPVRDPRVDVLSDICHPEKTVYAQNTFALCPDVVTGQESREWLDAARRCELLCFVVRAFESDEVYHADGSVDAARDLANLQGELLLADMLLVETRLTRLAKEAKSGLTPAQIHEQTALHACMASLEDGVPLSEAGLSDHDIGSVHNLGLLSLLPQLCVLNVSEDAVTEPCEPGKVSVSCLIEQEITAIEEPAERREFLATLGLTESGVDRVNEAAYAALGLMSFYTIGPDEARAWTIPKGAHAPQAGRRIHSDIERGFIRVEVIKFDDLVAAGAEKAAKENGKVQVKGKDYVMEDGDICHFLFSV